MLVFELVQQAFNFVVPLALLLGLLIFVHELGHFSVAKYFGVRVETFSIGFGKKIWQRTKGDTTYCLSLIPFGGYVKMFGDDPSADIPESERAHSFLHKNVWQRIAVVLAGPLMNFFFAILVFALIGLVGEDKPLAVVGEIEPQSPAYIMGLQAGDKILAVNNTPVQLSEQVSQAIENNADGDLELLIERYGSKEKISLKGKTISVVNPNPLSTKDRIGSLQGLQWLPLASAVGVSNPNSPAAKAGIKTGSLIRSVNKKSVSRWYELGNEIDQAVSSQQELEIGYQLEAKEKGEVLTARFAVGSFKSLEDLGLHPLDLFVGSLVEGSAAATAGIRAGDRILSIDDQRITHWSELVNRVRAFEKDKKALVVALERNGNKMELEMSPNPVARKDPFTGKEVEVYAIGISTSLLGAPPELTLVRTPNFAQAIAKGLRDSHEWSVTTLLSFWKLISNEVSANSIGGPLMIGQLASQSMAVGFSAFLKIMGIISINLFVLNLLPLPVLDGGHLLFYSIEAIRGKPVSMRVMEVAQTFGLVLLLSLMLFATYNDFARFLGFL